MEVQVLANRGGMDVSSQGSVSMDGNYNTPSHKRTFNFGSPKIEEKRREKTKQEAHHAPKKKKRRSKITNGELSPLRFSPAVTASHLPRMIESK